MRVEVLKQWGLPEDIVWMILDQEMKSAWEEQRARQRQLQRELAQMWAMEGGDYGF